MALEEYRKQIANLSVNDQKLRKLYLRKLALGEIQGPPTGYASLDKPCLKYYRDNPIKDIKENQTIYEMIFNQDDMSHDAIGYLGVNWNLEKLKKETDRCANAFKKNGIKCGDVVLVGMSNTPEAITILLALNKLGAISKWFDLRANENDIEKYANSSNCKYMVSFDMILPKVKNVIDKTDLRKVIVVSPVDSLPKYKRAIYNAKNKINKSNVNISNDKRFIKYLDFVHQGKMGNETLSVEYDENRPSIMIQSSGTTGKPKTIIHSDKSAINAVKSLAYSDLPLGKNKTALVALPPWIAYCLGEAILYPLALGSKVELCPKFDPDSVYKNIGKFTISFAAPFHYRFLREKIDKLSTKQQEQFKNIECMISGGDKVSIEENRDWEKAFNTVVVNGYGNNEGWGALSVNPAKANKYGTVGIPKYGETIISYDKDNMEELRYGEVGEICSLAKTQFIGYEKNDVMTSEVKVKHKDNNVWLHTGDLGYIDNEGYIHLEGRARRVIVRLGFKISAYTIEDNISENDFVKECVAVSVKDENEEHVPMCYVILKDNSMDKNLAIQKILDRCKYTLKEYEIPKYVRVVDNLPYTQNGKYDFRTLEMFGNEYVDTINNVKSKEKTIIKK